MLSTAGIGTKKIIIKDAGTCPKTIAVTATCLSLCDLTILFHKACKNAANKTAKNTTVLINFLVRSERLELSILKQNNRLELNKFSV